MLCKASSFSSSFRRDSSGNSVLFLVGIGGNLWNGTRMIMRGGDGKFSDGRAEFEVLS